MLTLFTGQAVAGNLEKCALLFVVQEKEEETI